MRKFYPTVILYIIIFLTFVSVHYSYSQNIDTKKIKGIVINEYAELIEGASVRAITIDSVEIGHVISSETGEFELPVTYDNEIIITVRHLGYKQYASKPFMPRDTTINVCIEYEFSTIGEITITGKKSMLKMKDGNLVIDVSKIPNADNLSIKNLLNKVPGVSTQDGLSLNGSVATLYIDGVAYNSNSALVLESLQGAVVHEIDLLSLPTAEWGVNAGPIINIRTKKRGWDGYYLTIGSTQT